MSILIAIISLILTLLSNLTKQPENFIQMYVFVGMVYLLGKQK